MALSLALPNSVSLSSSLPLYLLLLPPPFLFSALIWGLAKLPIGVPSGLGPQVGEARGAAQTDGGG